MNFARRASIALVTSILAISGIALTAGPAEASRHRLVEDHDQVTTRQTQDFYGHN